jgi:hypothetical protein
MAKKKSEQTQYELQLEQVSFEGDSGIDLGSVTDLKLDTHKETMWASIAQMSELFGQPPQVITSHLRKIFMDAELDEANVVKMLESSDEQGREYRVQHYNLDVILSVGYRVSSRQATKFRQWATGVLTSYILKGYALDESRLEDDPNALKTLAAEVRRLRTKKQNIYQAVRECLKISAADYDPKSKVIKSFFAKLQDKFLVAITGETASQVILSRADSNQENMGLRGTSSGRVKKTEAHISKNYLHAEELYGLHILCEQFLLFAESRAIRGHKLTMSELHQKFDELLRVQGHEVLSTYDRYIKDKARSHANKEY